MLDRTPTIAVTPRLRIEPICREDFAELEAVLRNDDVYRYIGRTPSPEEFSLRSERALAGPPQSRGSEVWLNFGVRLRTTGELVGRLEATVHDGVAEVALLFGPAVWGKGYATEGLLWLHKLLDSRSEPPTPWATTTIANTRSQGLLRRCGYREIASVNAPHLLTYDEGDLVFMLPRPSVLGRIHE